MTLPARRGRTPRTVQHPMGWARTPFAELDDLLNQMGGLIEAGAAETATAAWTPLADVSEGDNAYRVEVELPGIRTSDIDVAVSGQELQVSGEIGERQQQGTLRRSSRRTGRFEYRVMLPMDVDADGVTAEMDNGVLAITVPKAEADKPRRVRITEHGDS
jgi:HSP20 family protein